MKSLLLFFGICTFCACQVSAQPGSSCSDPKILSVNDSVCVFVTPQGSETGSNFDSIQPTHFNNLKVKPKEIYWFKFTASAKNIGFLVRNSKDFTLSVYSGSCGSLVPVAGFCSYLPYNSYMGFSKAEESMFGALENLVVGNDYFVQASTGYYQFPQVIPICVYKLPDQGTKIISKQAGGFWQDKSSWVQGRLPTPVDTAIIADGSTITINQQNSYAVKRLEVGQGGAAIAKLSMQSEQNQFWIWGDMVIHGGDSLVAKKTAIFGDQFALYGNLINNGIFSYFKKNQVGFTVPKPSFFFRSRSLQTVSGTGQFAGSGIPCLLIDNPAGVKWNMDGYCRSQIYLKRGLFDNSQANIQFHYDTLNVVSGQVDGSFPGLSIENGLLSKKIPNVSIKIPNFKLNSLFYAQIKDDSLSPNRDIQLDDYYPIGTAFYNLDLGKWAARKLISTRSVVTRSIQMLNNGIFQGGPGDTLTFYSCSFNKKVSSIRHSTFGYHQIKIGTGSTTEWSVPAWSGGKGRSFALLNYGPGVTSQAIVAHVLNQPPGGTLQTPGTFFMGAHVVEIKSNFPLGSTTKLRLDVYSTDNLVGLKSTWRIIQSASPSGPWTVLPVATGLDSAMTTTNGISLANGNYFAFASVSSAQEAVLTRVLPLATYRYGCGGTAVDSVALLVNNNGLTSINSLVVGALMNGNYYFRTYSVGQNMVSPLTVGQTDTFRVLIPNGQSGLWPVKYFVSVAGDGNRANDTIKTNLNTVSKPLPVSINFDTCKFLNTANAPNKFGQPIVLGWENAATGVSITGSTNGNSFNAIPSGTPGSNKYHLVSELYFPRGQGSLRTSNFGPIGAHTWLSYTFNIVDNPSGTNEIGINDTLWVESSSDCGESYTKLRTINRSNFTQYLSAGLHNNSNAPSSKWWDSIPEPVGSNVHIRFRMKTNQTFFSFGEIRLNDFRVVDTLFTGVSPLQLAKREILVYPNPAQEEVFIQLPEGEQAREVQLIDILGRSQTLEMDAENRVLLKGICKGVYLMEVMGNSGKYRKRLVKE